MGADDLLLLAQRAASEGWKGQPGRPPARGTRTIGMCSFDARNRGSTRLPLKINWRTGGTCEMEDQSAPIPEEITSELGGAIYIEDGRSTGAVGIHLTAPHERGVGERRCSRDAHSWDHPNHPQVK